MKIFKITYILAVLFCILIYNNSNKIKLTFISDNCNFLIVTNDGNIKSFIVQETKSINIPINSNTIIRISAIGKFNQGTRVLLKNGFRELHILNFDKYQPIFTYECHNDILLSMPLNKPKKNEFEKYNRKGDIQI